MSRAHRRNEKSAAFAYFFSTFKFYISRETNVKYGGINFSISKLSDFYKMIFSFFFFFLLARETPRKDWHCWRYGGKKRNCGLSGIRSLTIHVVEAVFLISFFKISSWGKKIIAVELNMSGIFRFPFFL